MVETLFGILTAILCVSGAVSIIKWMALKFAVGGENDKRVYAVLLDGKDADIRLQMMIQTLQWENSLSGVKAYAVDGGLDDEMAVYCRILCENTKIKFVSANEAKLILNLFEN